VRIHAAAPRRLVHADLDDHLAARQNVQLVDACPAPLSRSSAGRSAVSTSSGTRASCASITAQQLRGAVPDVQRPRRAARGLRKAEREEPRTALVDVRVAAQPTLVRGVSASGALRDPARCTRPASRNGQLVHEGAQQRTCRGWGHRIVGCRSVVLLHGFGGTHRAWDQVVALLDPNAIARSQSTCGGTPLP